MKSTARLARALAFVVVLATVATIPLVMLEQQPAANWVRLADWVIWAIFLFEYVTLLALSAEKRQYVRRTPVNLLVIIVSFPLLPAVLGLARLARLAGVLRLLRLAGVTAKGITGIRTVLVRRGFVYVAVAAAFLVLAGGTALALIEPQTVRGRIFDGICWALFTVTTVGYSDVTPSTVWGRMIGVILMLTSVGLVSTLAASITASFLGQEEGADLRAVRDHVGRIEALLAALTQELHRESSPRPMPDGRGEFDRHCGMNGDDTRGKGRDISRR